MTSSSSVTFGNTYISTWYLGKVASTRIWFLFYNAAFFVVTSLPDPDKTEHFIFLALLSNSAHEI